MVSERRPVVEVLTRNTGCRILEHTNAFACAREKRSGWGLMSKPIAAALLSSTMLCACQGVVWGNLAMLALTVGIFLGTLSLGRPKE
jgi:hypothetical protein